MIIIQTLSRRKDFGYVENEGGVTLFTGKNFESTICFSLGDINKLLYYFRDKDWFPLSNDQTGKTLKENGLGSFCISALNKLPKYASHIAAYLCNIGKLECRNSNGFFELKVNR